MTAPRPSPADGPEPTETAPPAPGPPVKRVLHAVTEFGVLSQPFIPERMLELERLGWQAWVATRSVSNRDQFPFPPDQRIACTRRPPLARRALGRLAGRYRSPLHASWWMAGPILKARPALVHAHFGWTAAEVLPVVKRAGLPLVVGFHGYDLTVFPKYGAVDLGAEAHRPPRRHRPYARLLAELDLALVVSRFLEGKLRGLGFDGPVEVVPTGIDLGEFPFRGPRPSDDDESRLVFIGRQVPYKGLDVLLRAMARLATSRSGLSLEVVGEGPTRRRNEALADQLGLSRLVRFHGALPRGDVVRLLSAADVLVAPSRTAPTGQAEGLGNVTKEALAVGLQVVATANGGLPETIPPPYRHELVPEADPVALSERLAKLLGERASWPGRARAGREWVERQFDWSRQAPRIADAYERAAERSRPRPGTARRSSPAMM
jgi:colanic acid/amylovoran biosynthesis glycosyltransferase